MIAKLSPADYINPWAKAWNPKISAFQSPRLKVYDPRLLNLRSPMGTALTALQGASHLDSVGILRDTKSKGYIMDGFQGEKDQRMMFFNNHRQLIGTGHRVPDGSLLIDTLIGK